MSRSALILGNGEPPSQTLLEEFINADTLLLCADGGADTARRYGYQPDYIVGDLDSASAASKGDLPPDRLIQIDADNTGTDIEKVLRYAVELEVIEAILLGFTGGRTDHLLWNLSALKTFGPQISMRLVDDHCDIRLIERRIRFNAAIGQQISLCPLNGPVEGIATAGLKFPLHSESLIPGLRDGISNQVVSNPVQIEIGQGDLLLCVQREKNHPAIQILKI